MKWHNNFIGMKFSTFCWHYEDLMLNSINYNHYGKPKLWYSIPCDERVKFEKVVRNKIHLLIKKDPNILLDIVTMINPTYLMSHNVSIFKLPLTNSFQVTVYRTLQMPGEYVLTMPGSYHGGFSTGLNIGEAVNFVTSKWVEHGLEC